MTSIGPSGIESQASVHFGEEEISQSTEPKSALEELQAELDELQASNKQKLGQVTSHGAQIEPMGVFQLRMQTITDFMFPPNTAERVQLEIAFESEMQTYLDRALSDVRQQLLTQGIQQGAGEGLVFPGNQPGPHPGHKRR